jgi:hypothetical protein
LGFWVQLGKRTEWSLACPGRGIAVDSSALLTADFAGDVVAGASLVGPAGSMPIGLDSGVIVVVEVGSGTWDARGTATGLGAQYELSLHPVDSNAIVKAVHTAGTVGLRIILCINGSHPHLSWGQFSQRVMLTHSHRLARYHRGGHGKHAHHLAVGCVPILCGIGYKLQQGQVR